MAILVKSNIKYQTVTIKEDYEENLEVYAISILSQHGRIILVDCYRLPDNGYISSQKWRKFLTQFSDHVLIYGDFNVHNQLAEIITAFQELICLK